MFCALYFKIGLEPKIETEPFCKTRCYILWTLNVLDLIKNLWSVENLVATIFDISFSVVCDDEMNCYCLHAYEVQIL